MKFYNSLGPNPRLVRMFMLEKGVDLERIEIDLMEGANRQAPYLEKNPAGEIPSLELDDGSVLAETVAICEYLEEMHPSPALIGRDPQSRAMTRMWVRRVEYRITNPLGDGFRWAEGLPIFKDRRHCVPQAADDLKEIAQEGLAWLEGLIEGRPFITGSDLTLADILLYCMLDFGAAVGQPLNPDFKNVSALIDRIAERASAEASLHPIAKAAGMRA